MAKRYKVNQKWPGVYGLDSTVKKVRGRPDVCYYINFKIDKKLVWEKVGWKGEGYSPEVASEIRARRVKDARHGKTVKTQKEIRRDIQKTDRVLDEIKKSYFESVHGASIKGRKTDLNRYEKHLQPHFGNRKISSLAPLDIDRVKIAMKSHKPATVSNALELLRRLVNYGVKNQLCTPLHFKITLPQKNNERTEYLTPEEVGRLLRVLDEWPQQDVARMLKLAMLTGMRRGEIFKLQTQDVDFNQKLIHLRDPKGGQDVSIPLSKPVKELFEDQIKWNSENPISLYIFPGKDGALRVDCSAVKRIKAAADLPPAFRIFHGLRHHFGVTLANSGEFTLDMIGSLLTHKDITITRRYAQFLPDTKRKAADRAADLLQEVSETSSNVLEIQDRRRKHESS